MSKDGGIGNLPWLAVIEYCGSRGSKGEKVLFFFPNSGVSISLFSEAKLKKCVSKLDDTHPACVLSRLSIGCGSGCVKNGVNSLCEGIRRHN